MHEGGRLQGVVGPLVAQIFGRAPPQLFINQRHQPGSGIFVPLAPLLQDLRGIWIGCVVHGDFVRRWTTGSDHNRK